jgi:ribosomal RNA assembly protein
MERIAILIGNNGETKKYLENKLGVEIEIDSKIGDISINDSDPEKILQILKLENIILAIGRGFSPEHAFRLLNDDVDFFVFDINDYTGKKEAHVRRLKSRIIGKNGKTKRVLEELTDSYISIYGHTVAVISEFINMDIIKKAIDKLLSGSKHASVYRFVEFNMRQIRLSERT